MGERARNTMSFLIICLVAFAASALTFFSGFGLGTLLLPAFALFFPVELAVAMTAVVHFLNGLFKLALIGRQADFGIVARFGLPSIASALLGAWLLARLSAAPPVVSYSALGAAIEVTPVKLVVGSALLLFALLEVAPRFRGLSFAPRHLFVGGLVSGFFGGLSGMQGALRSAFLVRAGLSKEAFVGTGVVIAVLVDVSRLAVYAGAMPPALPGDALPVLAAAVAAALLGAVLGNRYLHKVTLPLIQRVVAVLLVFIGLGLVTGLL